MTHGGVIGRFEKVDVGVLRRRQYVVDDLGDPSALDA